jgi:hypothetical protein
MSRKTQKLYNCRGTGVLYEAPVWIIPENLSLREGEAAMELRQARSEPDALQAVHGQE